MVQCLGNCQCFAHRFLSEKDGMPRIKRTEWWNFQTYHGFRMIRNSSTRANPATNHDATWREMDGFRLYGNLPRPVRAQGSRVCQRWGGSWYIPMDCWKMLSARCQLVWMDGWIVATSSDVELFMWYQFMGWPWYFCFFSLFLPLNSNQ